MVPHFGSLGLGAARFTYASGKGYVQVVVVCRLGRRIKMNPNSLRVLRHAIRAQAP